MRLAAWAGVFGLFFALRVPLLLAREPFFDELLTVWYAKKPLGQHWSILSKDSGSPLFMAVSWAAEQIAPFTVFRGRILSLLFGLGALLLCLRVFGVVAGAALAAFPPHIFFSTEARAYSLAALFIGIAAVALHRSRPAIAVMALVLAAYTHSYGVLFFPLPFVLSLLRRKQVLHGFAASALCGVFFLPGFWLASQQPLASIDWMRAEDLAGRMTLVARSFLQLGYAASYQPLFLTTPSPWLQVLSAVLVAAVVIAGLRKSESARFFAVFILVPIAGVAAFAAAGKTFYFPTRFESTLSVPFALLIASSLAVIARKPLIVATAALLTTGSLVAIRSAADHAAQPLTPYRTVAEAVAARVPAGETLIASGYAYLELVHAFDFARSAGAFPSEQAVHPGWVGSPDVAVLRRELPMLPPRFIWIGVAGTPEAAVLGQRFTLRPIIHDGPVVAALAEEKS